MVPIRPKIVLAAGLAALLTGTAQADPGRSQVVFAWPPSAASAPIPEPPAGDPDEAGDEDDEGGDLLAQETAAPRTGPAQPGSRTTTPARPGAASTPSGRTPSQPAATATAPAASGTTGATTAPGLALGAGAAPATTGGGSLLSGRTYSDSPVMLGDLAPFTMLRVFPQAALPSPPHPIHPIPPSPPTPGLVRANGVAVVPSVRGFKIADNQSPMPQDRVFFSFNDFYNVNDTVNKKLGAAVSGLQVYREILGVEKTLFDGDASIGLRMPINSLYASSHRPSLNGMSTSVGDLSIFGKYVLWRDQKTGSLISGGLSVTTPNGPTRFAGSPVGVAYRDAQIQPFLGFFFAFDRFYIQGFTSIDVPTDPNDVTVYFNDVGIGYFLYKSQDPHALLQAFVPTFEVHINDPLNHRGALNVKDPVGMQDVVDLTYGANVLLGKRTLISNAIVTPVTGPRPFDIEYALFVNIYFGKQATGRLPVAPPVLGAAP
jgi:hypothetical protein